MKKLFLQSGLAIMFLIMLTAFQPGNFRYTGGAPAGYTGSPADGKNCTHCHNGTATTQADILSSNVGVVGYTPGEIYIIKVHIEGAGDKGFEVSPQDESGNLLGTLTAGEGNKLVGGGKYVTHSTSGSEDPMEWTFSWTAPDKGTGDVVFYGAFARNMSTTLLSSLIIPENIYAAEVEIQTEDVKIYPNPVKDVFRIDCDDSPLEKIEILNVAGLCVSEIPVTESGASLSGMWSFPASLPPGIYMLRFVVNGKTICRKIYKD